MSIGNENDKKIEAELLISVSSTAGSYFYAQVNKMTMGQILCSFGLSVPDVFSNTGFPNGFTIAFSTKGVF